jgi:hypothetical protein
MARPIQRVAIAGAAVVALSGCTSGGAAQGPAPPTVCPTSGDLDVVLNAAPGALESRCTDASPPTLTLAVAWSADGGGVANGTDYRNVQCTDGSIAYQGCPPSDRPVPVECLATLPVQEPCPNECTITLWDVEGGSSIGSIGVVSRADGAPELVWAQQGSCMYQRSF